MSPRVQKHELSVAVVIPTYNRVGLLRRALLSVEQQTLRPQRIVVVDDASSDGTTEMLEREFAHVEVVRNQQRAGVSAARNRGVGQCREDWIALLDSDDEWTPEKLERQAALIERAWEEADSRGASEPTLIHCDEIWIRNGNQVLQRRKHRKRGGRIFRDCLPLCAVSPSASLLRRDVLLKLGGFDESFEACEDYDLWLRWTARYPVHFVDEPLVVKYGGHDDQLSRKFPVMDRLRIKALQKLLTSEFAEDLSEEEHRAAMEMLRSKVTIVANGARKRGRESEALELERELQRFHTP